QGDFRLPVVSGLGEAVPLAERAGRMRMFQQFVAEIEGVRAGSSDLLSEADLSSAEDLRAMLVPPAGSAGGPAEGAQAVLVHFGSSDFGPRFVDRPALQEAGGGESRAVVVEAALRRQIFGIGACGTRCGGPACEVEFDGWRAVWQRRPTSWSAWTSGAPKCAC